MHVLPVCFTMPAPYGPVRLMYLLNTEKARVTETAPYGRENMVLWLLQQCFYFTTVVLQYYDSTTTVVLQYYDSTTTVVLQLYNCSITA